MPLAAGGASAEGLGGTGLLLLLAPGAVLLDCCKGGVTGGAGGKGHKGASRLTSRRTSTGLQACAQGYRQARVWSGQQAATSQHQRVMAGGSAGRCLACRSPQLLLLQTACMEMPHGIQFLAADRGKGIAPQPHLSLTPAGACATGAATCPCRQLNTRSSTCSLCMQGVARSKLLSTSTSPILPPLPPVPMSARGLSVPLSCKGPTPLRWPACGSVASSLAMAVEAGPMAKGSSLAPSTRDRSASACDSRERPAEAPSAPSSPSSSVKPSAADKPAARPDSLQRRKPRH
jgi:hypothetical protein